MVKIQFVGSFFGTSGFSVHLKSLSLACERLGHEVVVETLLPDNWEKMVNDEENDLLTKLLSEGDKWQVLINSPYLARAKFREAGNIALFMVFEGDVAPKQWAEIANEERIKIILVPSNHTKSALLQAGVKEEKIFVVPHGYDDKNLMPTIETHAELVSQECTFIWNKGWSKGENDRSGFADVLRAFTEEFKDEPNVRLLVHINPAYNGQGWTIEGEVAKIGIPDIDKRKCKIVVNSAVFTPLELAKFYKAGSFYIGTSKADAFNIPVLEAMAMGLIPITTSFGGQTDFVKGAGWVVNGVLLPATIGEHSELALYEQAKWLKIDRAELRKCLRQAYDLWLNDKEGLKQQSAQCIKHVEGWTWQDSAKRLIEVLEKNG